MTAMHVANCTQQFHDFVYQIAESDRVYTQTIPPGGQVRLAARSGDLAPADVERVVKHHERYGFIPVDEVGKRKGFNGLCYSLGRPVPFSVLQRGLLRNRDALIERGKEQRRGAAVAINERLQQQVLESGRGDVLQQLAVEVEERTSAQVIGNRRENENMARELADSPVVAEGIRVDASATAERQPRRRR